MNSQPRKSIVILAVLFHVSVSFASARESVPHWVFVSLLKSKEILTYQRDPQTGRLQETARTACPAEPAIMCFGAKADKLTLYVSMRSTGQLAAYQLSNDGRLQLLNLAPGGEDPAYLALDDSGRFLVSAYYAAGKVQVNAIADDGRIATPALQSVATAEKAHGVAFTPDNQRVYVPHTGPDRIYCFRFQQAESAGAQADNAGNRWLSPLKSQPFYQVPQDLHPRHALVTPNGRWLLANDEAADSLSVYRIAASGELQWARSCPTIPAGFDGSKNATARFQGCPGTDFYYVANRGHDSIAGFRFDEGSGQLTPLGIVKTEATPRSFTISADGQHLYVAGQDSGKIAAYRVGPEGQLLPVATYHPRPSKDPTPANASNGAVGGERLDRLVPWAILAVEGRMDEGAPD